MAWYSLGLLAQVMYLWTQLSREELETLMSWKPGVHKLEGLVIPGSIERTLSLNLKYLFPVPRRPTVVRRWFQELTRKSALRAYFWQQDNEDQPGTDPLEDWQLTLPFPRNPAFFPELTHEWFWSGVEAGIEVMNYSLSHSIPQHPPSKDLLLRSTLSPEELQRYMTEAQLLSFITDKNLGIVVVTCDWYKKEIKKFLNLPIFQRFPVNFKRFHQEVVSGLDTLRREYQMPNNRILPFLAGKKMQKFWDICKEHQDIPKFHGIPKIHKNPWKLRPIVPMHSYVTSQLAIILHHMLLPVQRTFPWICESSRTLASEVAEFNKSSPSSQRLHTGDVTAMYTSIKLGPFREAIQLLLREGNWYEEDTRTWIDKAIEFLWSNTVFQAQGENWYQLDGVPMGIHCGPVFANLYMAYYEQHYIRHVLPATCFYRRYIDDIFAINPQSEVLESMRFTDLQVVWEHSSTGLSFLDVYFHTHQGMPGVCFRPFEKALNHHQYLSWASGHPISVKKGMVKGELSRIRAISYKQSYFLTWKATFRSRLRLRGWPVRVLKSWMRQVQWQPHFSRAGLGAKKEVSRIIAKSEYNPIWEEVSSTDIWQAMRRAWIRHAPRDQPLPFPPHCLVAKKRTRSLWDNVRSVNRNLLNQDEEETEHEELSDVASTLDESMPFSPH